LRFTLEGQAVDVRRPFPAAPVLDQTGAYVHMNALAQVGDRLAVMLHNGGAEPKKFSELAWLDRDWTLIERHSLPGHCCHDIVEDEHDVIWHCSTMSGDIIGSDGTRINITDQLMTRGLALGSEAIAVGVSTFGPRGTRDRLPGGVVILDRSWKKRVQIPLPAPASDIIAL